MTCPAPSLLAALAARLEDQAVSLTFTLIIRLSRWAELNLRYASLLSCAAVHAF